MCVCDTPVPRHKELKQQGDGAGETSRTHKLRVAGHGLGNTRARRTNTANRAPNMLIHHYHVFLHIGTVSIEWKTQTNPPAIDVFGQSFTVEMSILTEDLRFVTDSTSVDHQQLHRRPTGHKSHRPHHTTPDTQLQPIPQQHLKSSKQ